MKIILLTLISLLTVSTLDAQKLYKPKKKRKDFFGKVESPNDGKVRPIGLQVQVGQPSSSSCTSSRSLSTTSTTSTSSTVVLVLPA